MVDLHKITGIMGQAVDALYDCYGQRLERIEQANISDLKRLKGVGDLSAKCTYAFFHEPAYEIWYNQNIREPYNKKSDFEVIKKTLGKRIGEILENNFRRTAEPIGMIKGLSIEELKELWTTIRQDTLFKRGRDVKIKISPREAEKIHAYFHSTGYEFHSRAKEGITRQKKIPEYHPSFSEKALNKTLSLILERKIENWRKTIENLDVFREFIHFERFMLYYNQNNRLDKVTTKLPRMFIDFRNFAFKTFDPNSSLETRFYRDRTKKDIMSDSKYKNILKKFRSEQELFI